MLTERLLILATPSAAAGEITEVVSLRDLVDDAISAIAAEGAASRDALATDEGDAVVRGDAALLQTMVANALSNAIKFGGRARIEVTHEGDLAVVRIDDEGPGVAPPLRERVFEPFFRVELPGRARVPGSGLGLALVRHIAAAHGGDAAFVDRAGDGARLQIRLPLAQTHEGQ